MGSCLGRNSPETLLHSLLGPTVKVLALSYPTSLSIPWKRVWGECVEMGWDRTNRRGRIPRAPAQPGGLSAVLTLAWGHEHLPVFAHWQMLLESLKHRMWSHLRATRTEARKEQPWAGQI